MRRVKSVIERVVIGLIAVMGALVLFGLSAQASEGDDTSVSTPVTSPAPVMGPAAPSVERVANSILLPQIASAECFNIYRNGVLIGDCVKPLIDPASGDWYYDDSSEVVKPATRFTYSVSAVNATGESPRLYQTEDSGK